MRLMPNKPVVKTHSTERRLSYPEVASNGRDLLVRLASDPGTRTLGELIQERQWAVEEIHRSRALVENSVQQVPPPKVTSSLRLDAIANESIAKQMDLLRLCDVLARCGLARSTVYRLMRDELFPKPVKVGFRAVRWRDREITEWVKSRS